MKSLKYIRISLAILSVLAITALFVGAYSPIADQLDFMARIQLVPAFLSLNFIAIIILLVLTLFFGRVYCSVICPLGIFQDIILRLRKILSGKKKRAKGLFHKEKNHSTVRLVISGCFLVVVLLGFLNVMALSLGAIIEPYSAFGRMVTAFVNPIYDAVHNNMAEASALEGEYLYAPISRATPVVLFVIAAVTFLVIAAFAFRTGRGYCNTVCPVGTLLGYISKISIFKVRFDNTKCVGCGSCERHCKASCIDTQNRSVDYTRCVDCMDCVNVCTKGAMKYTPISQCRSTLGNTVADNATPKSEKPGASDKHEGKDGRRVFLATLGTLTGSLLVKSAGTAIEKTTDGGLTPLKKRPAAKRNVRIVPPGAISQAHINAHCVGCQLCIQACPEGILSMSTEFSTLMQPVLNYEDAYCRPLCTRCSNVCPAGVFKPLDKALKSSWKIGTAVVNYNECLSFNHIDSCGNCERHCPAGAITMVEDETPVVNENICIGCGACEVHCPVGTVASMSADQPAIHVEGVSVQRHI